MCKCSAASRHYTMIPNKTEHEGAKGTKPFLAAMGVQKKNIEK